MEATSTPLLVSSGALRLSDAALLLPLWVSFSRALIFLVNALAADRQASRRYVLSAGVGVIDRRYISKVVNDKVPGVNVEQERSCLHELRP